MDRKLSQGPLGRHNDIMEVYFWGCSLHTHTQPPCLLGGPTLSLCIFPCHHFAPSSLYLLSYSALSPPQEGTAQKVEATEWRRQTALDKESSLSPLLHPQLCLQLATGQQASAPVWASAPCNTFCLDSGFVTWHFGFPWLGDLLKPPCPLCSICAWNLGEADVPTHPLGAYAGPGDVIGIWKRWPWTIYIFLKGPSQPQSYCSKPSRDLGSLALTSTAKSGQQINPSTEWTES